MTTHQAPDHAPPGLATRRGPNRPRTVEEFENWYEQVSGIAVSDLHTAGRWAVPCRCGADACLGWRLTEPAELAKPIPEDDDGDDAAPALPAELDEDSEPGRLGRFWAEFRYRVSTAWEVLAGRHHEHSYELIAAVRLTPHGLIAMAGRDQTALVYRCYCRQDDQVTVQVIAGHVDLDDLTVSGDPRYTSAVNDRRAREGVRARTDLLASLRKEPGQ